jgi:CBS domain containing-hemolysin-like protein
MNILLGLLVVVGLVAATAFFVAAEFAMLAADRSKLKADAEGGKRSAAGALALIRRMSFHLSGAQLGITIFSLALGFVAKPVVAELVDPAVEALTGREDSSISVLIALALSTVFLLVAGELIPKNIAVAKAEPTLYAMTPAIRLVHGLLTPIIVSFNGVANRLVRMLGIEPIDEPEEISSLADIEYLIRSSAASGSLDSDALSLLTRTLRFGDKTAADALAPRVKLDALPLTATVGDLIDKATETGHSRYPIYGVDLDDIVGVADITRVFSLALADRVKSPVATIMADPVVVPETKDLLDILSDFESSDSELVVVLDEHGGTAGILTLEDVLEEIAGEIDDEYDEVESPAIVDLTQGVYILEGTLHEGEVAEACGYVLPEGEDYETLAGYVLQEMGRIPAVGDSIIRNGWRLEVVEMDRLRVATLQLTPPDVLSETHR